MIEIADIFGANLNKISTQTELDDLLMFEFERTLAKVCIFIYLTVPLPLKQLFLYWCK